MRVPNRVGAKLGARQVNAPVKNFGGLRQPGVARAPIGELRALVGQELGRNRSDLFYQRNVLGPSSWPTTLAPVQAGSWWPGFYFADMPSLSVLESSLLVTAYSTAPVHCKPSNWFDIGNGTRAYVTCYDHLGVPIATRYTLSYATLDAIPG